MPRRLLAAAAITAVILAAVGAIFLFAPQKSGPAEKLPNPNGYDDLVKAGWAIANKSSDFALMDQEELVQLMSTNAEALRLLRLGLSRPCLLPTETAVTNLGALLPDLMVFKSLAQLLSAEGRLAEMEQRPADAARSYVDAIRLGVATSRGGILICRLSGLACEAVGYQQLLKLVPQLGRDSMRKLVPALEDVSLHAVPWDEVMSCESRFAHAQTRGLAGPARYLLGMWQGRRIRALTKQRHDAAEAHIRLLTTELALRCYLQDRQSAPSSLEQLVPNYLQHVPGDPFRDGPLVYQGHGTSWLLYSVGVDRVDDGGRPARHSGASGVSGDILFDSAW